jgi:hypothetical protein
VTGLGGKKDRGGLSNVVLKEGITRLGWVVGTWGGGGNEDIFVLGAGVEAAVPPFDCFCGEGGMGTTEVADLIEEVDNRFFLLSGRPEGGGLLVFVLDFELMGALTD